MARLIRKMRALYAEKRQAILNAGKHELEGLLEILRSDAGMHLMGWLREGIDERSENDDGRSYHVRRLFSIGPSRIPSSHQSAQADRCQHLSTARRSPGMP